MSDTYEPITPGTEQKPAVSVPVYDSEAALQQLPPGPERQAILGEVEPGEEITIEEAVRQQRSRRGQQPSDGVNFKVDGRTTTRPQSDREAARDVTFAKRAELTGRIMQALPGVDVETAGATAFSAEKGGFVHEYKLDDKDKADPLSPGDSLEQALHRKTAIHEQKAADLHALVQQLAEQPTTETPPAEAVEQQQQQPPLQQPEQPQQPDPIQQARAAAEAAIQSAQEYQRLSADEAHVHAWFAQTVQGFYQKYGNPTMEQIAELEKTNPALVKQMAADYQQLQTGTAQLNELRARREFRERQIAEGRAAEMNKAAAKWLSEQDALAAKALPELNDPQRGPELQRAAVEVLRDAGLSDEEVNALWHGKQSVNLRDVRSQKILADAAKWRLAQSKAHAARPEPLPQVMRPGTAMNKNEIAFADQRSRLDRLTYMSGQDAAREGARLLAERRGRR